MTGPSGRRVLRFDGPFGPEGCGIAYGAMSIICRSAAAEVTSPLLRSGILSSSSGKRTADSGNLVSSRRLVFAGIFSLAILTEILRFLRMTGGRREYTSRQQISCYPTF